LPAEVIVVNTHTLFWLSFIAVYLIVFFIDMYVTSHRKGEIAVGTALRWTGLWISIALLYGLAIYLFYPQNVGSTEKTNVIMAIKYVAGYLTEYSLSVDNLFVFIMIFSLMGVHPNNQPRLLKLGILLSIVLRIIFILVGMGLVQRFGWIIFTSEEDHVDPTQNILYKQASKMFPLDPDPHTPKFFTRHNGKLHITSVMLVFLVIGSTDVLFAVDSIPAIIGVIKEGAAGALTLAEEDFIAITSNVFAVMGLVSLFFGLKGIMGMFRFLKHGVSFILFFIGMKMILGVVPAVEHFFKAHSWVSLAVIVATLVLSVVLSTIIKEEADEAVKAERVTSPH
jgi:tellurite resistance protein TerC